MNSTSDDFSRKLLNWFDGRTREMPWRGETDVYRVWLSEVMLQQTQVETVIPYYRRWLEVFPTLEDAAAASEEQVLKVWEGLGYYARARNLRRACRIIVREHNGAIPDDPELFRRLPGVGPYTFAAVWSICHGRPIPAIDGNIRRVISRILTLESTSQNMTPEVEAFMQGVMPPERPGDFNQALMDLGSAICISRSPLCNRCPVGGTCRAYSSGTVDQYPRREFRKKKPHYRIAAGAVWRDGRLLICRRPPDGLLGGLWELPGGKINSDEAAEKAVQREIMEEVGIDVDVVAPFGTVRHTYSHFSITLTGFHCHFISGTPQAIGCTGFRWIPWGDILKYPFPKANHKLFPLIEPHSIPINTIV